MGAHARGAEASRLALEAFALAVEGDATLDDAVEQADLAVRSLADGCSMRAPGTTLVAARRDGATVRGVWSGYSRAYRRRADDVFEPLTVHHTGPISGLEHALGAFDPGPVTVDAFEVPVDATVGLLLCTDGLNGPLEDAWTVDEDPTVKLGMLLADRGLAALADLTAETGSDNVTALLWLLRQPVDT